MRFFLTLLFASMIHAQASLIDYDHPYHSTYTNKGIVVSQNYLSSDIGVEILDQGGNAVDAAIAVGFSLAATLPRAGNIGGGGFMQIYIEKDKTILSLDFRSTAPALATREFYQELKSQDDDVTRKGYKAIAVPGTIAGLYKAHELYGSLPMETLLQPTIDLLTEGVPMTQDLYHAINIGKYISDDLKFTSGIISALKGIDDSSSMIQVDAALNPGNSGGPIVDEETGKLVAVSVMGMKKSISEGQNFGIKTSSVRNFLESNQVKVPSSWFKSADVAKLLEESTLYTYCR